MDTLPQDMLDNYKKNEQSLKNKIEDLLTQASGPKKAQRSKKKKSRNPEI